MANWRGFERFGPGGWLLRLASLAASSNLLAMSERKWCGSGGERGMWPARSVVTTHGDGVNSG